MLVSDTSRPLCLLGSADVRGSCRRVLAEGESERERSSWDRDQALHQTRTYVRGEDAGRVGVGRGERPRGRRGATGEVPPSSISSSKFAPPLLVPRFWSKRADFEKNTERAREREKGKEETPSRRAKGQANLRRKRLQGWRWAQQEVTIVTMAAGRHRVHYSLLESIFFHSTIGQTYVRYLIRHHRMHDARGARLSSGA